MRCVLVGFVLVSLVGGHLLAILTLRAVNGKWPRHKLRTTIVGFVERAFFTIAAAANPGQALAPMLIWVGAKAAARRPYSSGLEEDSAGQGERTLLRIEFARLAGALASLLAALTAGALLRVNPACPDVLRSVSIWLLGQ